MSIFSNFVNSDVPKIDPALPPHVGTMFNFVEIYRFSVNSLTISQNFIYISFLVKKLLQKTFGGSLNPPLWWAKVNIPDFGFLGSKASRLRRGGGWRGDITSKSLKAQRMGLSEKPFL